MSEIKNDRSNPNILNGYTILPKEGGVAVNRIVCVYFQYTRFLVFNPLKNRLQMCTTFAYFSTLINCLQMCGTQQFLVLTYLNCLQMFTIIPAHRKAGQFTKNIYLPHRSFVLVLSTHPLYNSIWHKPFKSDSKIKLEVQSFFKIQQ